MSLINSLQNAKDINDVREILSTHFRRINQKDEADFTPLMWASRENHIQILTTLLEYGADVNDQTENGATALMWAICWGHLEVVQLLVKWGADINIPSVMGHTPIIVAIKEGYPLIAKYLIEQGADVNLHSNGSVTALMCALISKNSSLVWQLMESGADLTILTREGKTALDYASEYDMLKEYFAYLFWQQRKQFLIFLYSSQCISTSSNSLIHSVNHSPTSITEDIVLHSSLQIKTQPFPHLKKVLENTDLTRFIMEYIPSSWSN